MVVDEVAIHRRTRGPSAAITYACVIRTCSDVSVAPVGAYFHFSAGLDSPVVAAIISDRDAKANQP
jgi:hypothetical protein